MNNKKMDQKLDKINIQLNCQETSSDLFKSRTPTHKQNLRDMECFKIVDQKKSHSQKKLADNIQPAKYQQMEDYYDARMVRWEPKAFHSNNILAKEYYDCICFVLPAYLRISFQGISKVAVLDKEGAMMAVLIVSIYYGDLPKQLVDQIEKNLEIIINNSVSTVLDQDSLKDMDGSLKITRNQENKIITYVVRREFPLEMQGQVLFTPFQKLNLELSVKLTTITTKFLNKLTYIDFNLQYPFHQDKDKKLEIDIDRLYYLKECEDYGEYGLAESTKKFEIKSSVPWQSSNDYIKKQAKEKENVQKQIKSKTDKLSIDAEEARYRLSFERKCPNNISCWDTAVFKISIYRYPFTFILSVFLPTVMLALFNLGIFFQQQSLGARISSLATLLVAYAAFLPTVRQRIPPSPQVTLVELCLYAVMTTSLLCFTRSWIDKDIPQSEYSYNWKEDPFYLICLSIVLMVVLVMTIGILVHKLYLEPSYNAKDYQKQYNSELEDRAKWNNRQANEYWQHDGFASQFQIYNSEFFPQQKIFERLWFQRIEEEINEKAKYYYSWLRNEETQQLDDRVINFYQNRQWAKTQASALKFKYTEMIEDEDWQTISNQAQREFYEKKKEKIDQIIASYEYTHQNYSAARKEFFLMYQEMSIREFQDIEFCIIERKRQKNRSPTEGQIKAKAKPSKNLKVKPNRKPLAVRASNVSNGKDQIESTLSYNPMIPII